MDPEALRRIVEEVVNDADTFSWLPYIVVVLLAGLTSFAGSYLRRKGENFATKEDFNALLGQLEQTTQVTEEIKARVSAETEVEKTIRIDGYSTARDIQSDITNVSANLNRLRHGIEVPDFIKNGEPIPLSEIFNNLQARRYLLSATLYKILYDQVQSLIEFARAENPRQLAQAKEEYLRLSDEFQEQMNKEYGISNLLKPRGKKSDSKPTDA